MESTNGAGAPAQATPASEFRRGREQGELITLPYTGRRVRMRTVKPGHLLRLGQIPDILAEVALKTLYGKMTNEEYAQLFAVSERKEHALELVEATRIVCTAALIEPRIVEEPAADDEIAIDDLDDVEQSYIFRLALWEASELSRFRQQQAAGVAGVDDGESDGEPAQQAAGGQGEAGSIPF